VRRTVVGVFERSSDAERAVDRLQNKGFSDREISIISREDAVRRGERGREEGRGPLTSGVTGGGALGGLAGLLAGAGALAIPGVGPILAVGPIAAGLSGAAAGGLAGGLVDWGIPETRGRQFEEEVRQGRILTMVQSEGDRVEDAAEILREFGARNVEIHEGRS